MVLEPSTRRSESWVAHFAAAILLGLNIWICWRLFSTEYLSHFGSVEPIFFAIAKGIRERWPHPGWWGQSSLGYPFEYSYQPLLHYCTAALAEVASWSEAHAYHFSVATFYAFGAVTAFYLARRLSHSTGAGFVAGILYSVCAPSAILMPGVAGVMEGTWFARRLHVALGYGDGPNISGLTLVPLALLMLDRALEKKTPGRWIAAAVALAAVGLTNIPATIALAFGILSYSLALPWRTWLGVWVRSAGIAITGFLLFAPWIPPSGLMLNSLNVQSMNPEGALTAAKLPYLLALVAAVGIALVIFQRLRVASYVRFAWVYAMLLTSIAMLSIVKHVDLIGQASRFHVAMELPIILALVFTVHALFRWTKASRSVVAILLIGLCAYIVPQLRIFARKNIFRVDISQRSEYKISRWMDANAHGDRVFVAGGTAFWLNYLADGPQVRGCCDQNMIVPGLRDISAAITVLPGTGDAATDPSVRWLQILGVHYVATSGEISNEAYKDFVHPDKYRGMLREVWRDQDDAIFEVPLRTPSLAHPIDLTDVLMARDEAHLEQYRTALMDGGKPNATLQWISTSDAVIQGSLTPNEVYSVQIPYHVGWKATRNGVPVRTTKDVLAFQVLHPDCDGPCEVQLHFDGGTERTILWIFFGLSWGAIAATCIIKTWGARSSS